MSYAEAAICYCLSNHLKVEVIPLSALPKDTTSELARLVLHTNPLMLNFK